MLVSLQGPEQGTVWCQDQGQGQAMWLGVRCVVERVLSR